MSALSTATEEILKDYLAFTGRDESGRQMVSAADYLAFRKRAKEELLEGFHTIREGHPAVLSGHLPDETPNLTKDNQRPNQYAAVMQKAPEITPVQQSMQTAVNNEQRREETRPSMEENEETQEEENKERASEDVIDIMRYLRAVEG